MRCDEIMKDDVQTVAPDDSVQVAARKMKEHNVGFLPVLNPAGRVMGTLTDRDLALRVIAAGLTEDTAVKDVMTRELISCLVNDDLARAEQRMRHFQKSRIMCLDGQGRLAGVISLSDIAQCENDEQTAKVLRDVSQRETAQIH
jgi:CBS domain-containing protein